MKQVWNQPMVKTESKMNEKCFVVQNGIFNRSKNWINSIWYKISHCFLFPSISKMIFQMTLHFSRYANSFLDFKLFTDMGPDSPGRNRTKDVKGSPESGLQTQTISFLKSLSERVGSDVKRLWMTPFSVDFERRCISDPTL